MPDRHTHTRPCVPRNRCSPDPVQYLNGTATFQCVEQTAKGIICPNYWMTFGCVPGYICNEDTGTCEQTAPGEGGTLENCEAACSPKSDDSPSKYAPTG